MVSSLRTIAKSRAGRGAAFYKKKRCFDSVSSSHRSLALSSGNYLHLVVASKVADHDHSAKHWHVLQKKRTLQIIFWIASLLLYLEYCPWKAAAHAIPEDVHLWWIWLWLWWWQYRWGFSLVKMLLITRPSILCMTHQMSRIKRDYSVDWTVPYEMMNYKWYLMVLGQYIMILAGTCSVQVGTAWH